MPRLAPLITAVALTPNMMQYNILSES